MLEIINFPSKKDRQKLLRSDRLKALREAMGFTQEVLGDLCGETKKQIYRFEHGEAEPKASTLALMAKSLNCSSDYLIGLADERHGIYIDQSELSDDEKGLIVMLRSANIDPFDMTTRFTDYLRERNTQRQLDEGDE